MTKENKAVGATVATVDSGQLSKKRYILARTALQLEDFSLAELAGLTRILPKTIGTFVRDLTSKNLVSKRSMQATGRGRPRKGYLLLPEGRQYLLNYMASVRRETRSLSALPFQSVEPEPVQFPLIRAYQKKEEYFIFAAVPGLNRSNLECSIEENRLTLCGNKQALGAVAGSNPEGGFAEYQEPDAFMRCIHIPHTIRKPQIVRDIVVDGEWIVKVAGAHLPHEIFSPHHPSNYSSKKTYK